MNYLDFLKYDQLFLEGETPASIEATLRESVDHRAEELFSAVESNLSQIESITNQWLKEAENLPILGSAQKEELKALERNIEVLREQKGELSKTLTTAKEKLEEQKGLRGDLLKSLENYQIVIENIPDRDPREKALIEGGQIICKGINDAGS